MPKIADLFLFIKKFLVAVSFSLSLAYTSSIASLIYSLYLLSRILFSRYVVELE